MMDENAETFSAEGVHLGVDERPWAEIAPISLVTWTPINLPALTLRQRLERQWRLLPDRFRAFADPDGWNADM